MAVRPASSQGRTGSAKIRSSTVSLRPAHNVASMRRFSIELLCTLLSITRLMPQTRWDTTPWRSGKQATSGEAKSAYASDGRLSRSPVRAGLRCCVSTNTTGERPHRSHRLVRGQPPHALRVLLQMSGISREASGLSTSSCGQRTSLGQSLI